LEKKFHIKKIEKIKGKKGLLKIFQENIGKSGKKDKIQTFFKIWTFQIKPDNSEPCL